MSGFRFLTALAAAGLLSASPASAQDRRPAPQPPPLKPGQSAGVQAAQQTRTGVALIGAGAVIAVVIVAATASNGGNGNNQVNPQTQSTTTTP